MTKIESIIKVLSLNKKVLILTQDIDLIFSVLVKLNYPVNINWNQALWDVSKITSSKFFTPKEVGDSFKIGVSKTPDIGLDVQANIIFSKNFFTDFPDGYTIIKDDFKCPKIIHYNFIKYIPLHSFGKNYVLRCYDEAEWIITYEMYRSEIIAKKLAPKKVNVCVYNTFPTSIDILNIHMVKTLYLYHDNQISSILLPDKIDKIQKCFMNFPLQALSASTIAHYSSLPVHQIRLILMFLELTKHVASKKECFIKLNQTWDGIVPGNYNYKTLAKTKKLFKSELLLKLISDKISFKLIPISDERRYYLTQELFLNKLDEIKTRFLEPIEIIQQMIGGDKTLNDNLNLKIEQHGFMNNKRNLILGYNDEIWVGGKHELHV